MDIKTETLYLARGGKEDIFVEKCPNQQHVIDGIRFLYRQFVKKKPGLILNDANSHSRRTQIVLFVSAIRPILERPVLILCSEGDENKWRECFEIWANMANDITTDTTNPFAKKVSVYISPIHEATKFYSREWSGVIIDSDIIHKEILKCNVNAKFKVWITGVDVKNDLTQFSQLYKWLYPKERFDPNIFKYDKRDPRDVVAKAILLDSFMEDVVLRGNVFENTAVKSPETPKVTRKNKDATGTKIKRTKRKNRISSSEDDSPTKMSKTITTNDNNFTNNTLKHADISNIRFRPAIDDSREIIDDFRVTIDETRAPIDGTRSAIDDTRATIDILSSKTVDSSKIRIEYYDEDQINDQSEKSNEILEKSPVNSDDENNSMDLFLKYEVDEKYTPVFNKNNENQEAELDKSYLDQNQESNDSAYGKDTQENFDDIMKLNDTESCHGSIKDGIKSNDKYNKPNEITKITSNDQIVLKNNKIENEIDIKPKELTKRVEESEDLFSTESIASLNKITNQNVQEQQIALNINENEINSKPKQAKLLSEDLFSTESVSALNKIEKQNEICKDGVGNNETDPGSSLDTKIKQMQELAMKKFKGSLLDSIF